MAVVRWLCDEPRPHLKSSLFVVHSHNPGASLAMIFQLQSMGYDVQEHRFASLKLCRRKRRYAWFSRVGHFLVRVLMRDARGNLGWQFCRGVS